MQYATPAMPATSTTPAALITAIPASESMHDSSADGAGLTSPAVEEDEDERLMPPVELLECDCERPVLLLLCPVELLLLLLLTIGGGGGKINGLE